MTNSLGSVLQANLSSTMIEVDLEFSQHMEEPTDLFRGWVPPSYAKMKNLLYHHWNSFQSISLNLPNILYISGASLIWVAILGLVVLYIYALVAFAFFRASFDQENLQYCHTLYECVITIIRFGLVGDIDEVQTYSYSYSIWSDSYSFS